MAKWWQLQRVVPAMQCQGAWRGIRSTQCCQHLLRELGTKSRIVLAVNHKGVFARSQSAFDVRHGANRRPIFPEFVNRDMRAERFPDMRGGHALRNHVREIRGHVEE